MAKNKRIIYVAGHGKNCAGYSNWLEPDDFTDDIEKATLVLGLGGSDVGNQYYNEPDSGYLYCSPEIDKREHKDYKKAIELGKPIVGICKGSQWLGALAGGTVFQDISHPSYHEIKTYDNKELWTNSLHHNMVCLDKLKENQDYKLLAWADNLSPHHINGYGKDIPCEKEPEVVFYPKINALGFQNHNEMIVHNYFKFGPVIDWSNDTVDKFLSNNL